MIKFHFLLLDNAFQALYDTFKLLGGLVGLASKLDVFSWLGGNCITSELVSLVFDLLQLVFILLPNIVRHCRSFHFVLF